MPAGLGARLCRATDSPLNQSCVTLSSVVLCRGEAKNIRENPACATQTSRLQDGGHLLCGQFHRVCHQAPRARSSRRLWSADPALPLFHIPMSDGLTARSSRYWPQRPGGCAASQSGRCITSAHPRRAPCRSTYTRYAGMYPPAAKNAWRSMAGSWRKPSVL